MMKRIWMIVCLFVLAACMVKPPVQEMAEARSAVKAAQAMDHATSESTAYLKSAEEALKQASEAIEQQRYMQARSKALAAKKQAQKAASISQETH
jgi:predicted S18 family serine protease